MPYILALKTGRLPLTVGNKAKNLRALMDKGFRVPPAYVCTWEAYGRYVQNDPAVLEQVGRELTRQIAPDRLYAVRSSANLEDHLAHSFAGQFKSILNVPPDKLTEAIGQVWTATHSDSVRTYLQRAAISPENLKMAVIVQEMAQPVLSGVAFSKNPLTGLDEVVVEAVKGSGDALVQDGVTPWRWVYKRGKWLTAPAPGEVDPALMQQVVEQTQAIAKAFKKDVDLEWVYDGQHLHWVQARDITSTQHINVYSNAIAKEQLPGMIKPLIWSVNIPLVNGAWIKLLGEVIGPTPITPDQLARPFYYRAYYNMGALGQIFESLGMPRASLELMMGLAPPDTPRSRFKMNRTMLKLTPRLLRFLADKWTLSHKIDRFLPAVRAEYKTFPLTEAGQLSETELLALIDRLFALNQQTAYYNIAGPLLMFAYNGFLRRQLTKLGLDFAALDLMHGLADLEQVDPAPHLARLNCQFRQLDPAAQAQILAATYDEFQRLPHLADFQQVVAAFLQQFGHLSDSGNDFSAKPWRENPGLILQLIPTYDQTAAKSTRPLNLDVLPVKGLRRRWLRLLYHRAQQFRLYREQINFVYTYGYGLFRVYFLALGEHFTRRGLLATPTDIFYLSQTEVRELVARPGPDYAQRVAQRRQEMDAYREVVLPGVIYGDDPPPPVSSTGVRLTGTPTSRGYYTGPLKVVRGLDDFTKLETGDVLAVPYSDVGWTPLFARAGAVISESGGMLSHSSIIAREYNIPAVVSVAGATHLADDTLVTVDGYKGEIFIHQTGEADGGS